MNHISTKNTIFLVAFSAIITSTVILNTKNVFAADDKKASPKPSLTVTLTQPQTSTLPLKLSANGSIAAWQEAAIGSEAQGLRLSELRADVGDRVQKGQLLAVFASEGIEADIAQARAALAEAEVAATAATQDADRARAIQATGALSAQQISQLLNAELLAKARVQTAKAQIASQQVRLKNTRVLAPDSGIISARMASLGSIGGGDMFRLIRQGRLEWRAEVTAAELPRLRVGAPVQVQVSNGSSVKGKVRLLAPTVDAQTRTALVYVELAAGSNLQPGLFAKGEFELGQTGGITLPQSAVVMRDGFAFIYPVNADKRVLQTKVQIGRTMGDRLEILTPLAAGTQKPRGQANETSRERGWQFECPDALSGLPCEEAGCNRGRTNAVVASAVLRIRRQTFTARRESAPTAVRSGSGGAPRRRDALAQSGARLRHA